MYTRKEKATLRSYWPHLRMRFRKDGTVEAKRYGQSWGVLLSERQARETLELLAREKREAAQ